MITETTLQTIVPRPPTAMINTIADVFTPAPEIDLFVKKYFLNEESELFNEDHTHLYHAQIGYLWTNIECKQKQKVVAGMAMIPTIQGNKWVKSIFQLQLEQWFGGGGPVNLDFIIIINAHIANELSLSGFCSLVDHELYHCAHKIDKYGELDFDDETGLPKLAIQGHDVEEFVGIMRRYGVEACAGQTKEFIEASKIKPLFTDANIQQICGNCLALRP